MYIGACVSDRLHGAVVVVTDLEMVDWPAVGVAVHVLTAATLAQGVGQMADVLAGFGEKEVLDGDIAGAISTIVRALRCAVPF